MSDQKPIKKIISLFLFLFPVPVRVPILNALSQIIQCLATPSNNSVNR